MAEPDDNVEMGPPGEPASRLGLEDTGFVPITERLRRATGGGALPRLSPAPRPLSVAPRPRAPLPPLGPEADPED